MSGLVEETIESYEAYRSRIDGLESEGPSKKRVVFLFEPAEGLGSLNGSLDGMRKKITNGTLIHVKIKKQEFGPDSCPYKTDKKFKVSVLPFGAVFNQKTTLGRDMIHKKAMGDGLTEAKLIDLLS